MKDHLDGPEFVDWLVKKGALRGVRLVGGHGHKGAVVEEEAIWGLYGGSWARRLHQWRQGCAASIYTADRLLCQMGMTLSEVPDEIWVENPRNKPTPVVEPEVKKKAVALYRETGSSLLAGQECGVSDRAIRKWAASEA